jgi:transposase-like protein
MDRGIHVHARVNPNEKKEMDCTHRAVRIVSHELGEKGILVTEIDAIYYMVTSIFGFQMKYVTCSYCGYPHLDKDWFSLHSHRRHLCAGCGKNFTDTESAIGNPILGARHACGVKAQKPKLSKKKLVINQADFPGGIQIWGSNPAFLWTSENSEEEGIHVHAFRDFGGTPEPDETYAEVSIDNVKLDPLMVRILVAQNTLPSIKHRVLSAECPSCKVPHFSIGELAFTPVASHRCKACGEQFATRGKLRKTVANPLPALLRTLAERAPRQPQHHDLGLLPENL